MSLRDATIDRERRDLVTHQAMDESRLIRFVAGPDGMVAPDLGRKLPGRGMWVEASRASVDAAVKKNLFSRSAKAPLKPTAVASSGWVRRQSRTGITRSATTVAKGRYGTSGRKIA